MHRHQSVATERAVILLVFGMVFTFVIWLSLHVQRPSPVDSVAPLQSSPTPAATIQTALPSSPAPTPTVGATPPAAATPSVMATPRASITPDVAPGSLVIPVIGVLPEQLRDTFDEARSEGRTHNAIDIMAACGTPVVAAIDGKILRLFQSERGGITIYQMGPDNKTVYYYAHLSRYAEGLAVGQSVKQGRLLAYVGDTGNAGAGNCHLHFAIWTVTNPKRYWDGEQINPYPLLRRAGR